MTRNHRRAFNALRRIGCPVFESTDHKAKGVFGISAEDTESYHFADYYQEPELPGWDFGVAPEVTAILNRCDLYAEWENPGCLTVWPR